MSLKKNFRQILSSSSVWLICAVYGFESGWSGPALKLLTLPNSPIPITPLAITWLSVVTTSGNILSIVVCTFAAQSYGRKPLLIVCCVILILSWLLNCFANTLALLFLSKFFINVSLGIFDVLNCIYVSEVSTTENRGVLVSMTIVFYTFGTEFEYLVGLCDNYMLLSAVPFVVSLVALGSLYFMVESPYFLIMRGKTEEAYKNLSILDVTGDTARVVKEYEELVKYAEEEKASSVDFLNYIILPQNYRSFVCLLVVNSLVYVNGVSAFAGYEPIIMRSYGNVNDDLVLNILGLIGIIGTLGCPFVVERWGRKVLMFNGFVLLGILQMIIGLCFYLDGNDNKIPFVAELIVFCVCLGFFLFEITVYPVIHVLRSEMLPHKLKESGTSVVVVFKAIMNGLVSASFFPIALAAGYGLNFVIYAMAALIGAIYVYFFLEETKDKTLAEIRKSYIERE